MLEAQLAYYLNRYLGTYVEGLNQRDLKVSVFRGDVVLKNLKLKPEALADLNLPISVKAGLLGSLTLKVTCLASFRMAIPSARCPMWQRKAACCKFLAYCKYIMLSQPAPRHILCIAFGHGVAPM